MQKRSPDLAWVSIWCVTVAILGMAPSLLHNTVLMTLDIALLLLVFTVGVAGVSRMRPRRSDEARLENLEPFPSDEDE